MSWDILPKSNLQYFLTKLKGIFDNKVDKETGKGLFSGNYNDLTNKPTIPAAANNNTITIQLNGTTVETFTLNQASDETINIQVTKSSVGLGNVGNFKAVSTEASQGLTDTEKSNARANIGAGTSSTDQQVYQENTNTNTDYRVLLGVENDITSYVYKSIGLRYNPGKDSVYTEKINDTVLGDAIGFDVQNSSSASDLTDGLLPTGQTIKSYLNSNLEPNLLLSTNDITTTDATVFNCNWSNYKYLIIACGNYENIIESHFIPASYMTNTNTGNRVMMFIGDGTNFFEVWQSGNNAVTVRIGGTGAATSHLRVHIYGIIPA